MFVRKIISVTVLIFLLCLMTFSQKLSEPKFLSNWIGGEDPSEMLIHLVLEQSAVYLKENSGGKLVVRICSLDDFSSAFMKTTLNPIAIKNFNYYSYSPIELIFPTEQISVSRNSNCADELKFSYTQYWFVPEGINLESEEIFPIDNIDYKSFYVFGHEKESVKRKTFEENIGKFVKELKDDLKLEGLIVHNSKTKDMERNIQKVKVHLKKKNISLERIKIVKAPEPDFDVENEKIILVENDKSSYPKLATLKIRDK